MQQPIIGIIGGMGPMAGLDVHRKLIEATPANRDQDHLNIIHVALPSAIADRTAFLLMKTGENPAIGMITAAEKLVAAGATVIIVACNTAHAPPIWQQLSAYLAQQAPEVRLLSMVDAVCNALEKINTVDVKVAVLSTRATYQLGIYQKPLQARGIAVHALHQSQVEGVHEAIYHREWGIKVKNGIDCQRAITQIETIIAALVAQDVSHVLLACAELPLVIQSVQGAEAMDPAKAVIKALQNQ